MIALLYLKHEFNLSDEAVVERWSETPRWQYFSGLSYYEERLPCDATTLVKFRRLLGEEGVEELLAQTVNLAVSLKLIAASALATVVVDSTVQEKAVAHPTDSRLLETARAELVNAAQSAGIELKQTFAKEGRLLCFKAGRYARPNFPATLLWNTHYHHTHDAHPLTFACLSTDVLFTATLGQR